MARAPVLRERCASRASRRRQSRRSQHAGAGSRHNARKAGAHAASCPLQRLQEARSSRRDSPGHSRSGDVCCERPLIARVACRLDDHHAQLARASHDRLVHALQSTAAGQGVWRRAQCEQDTQLRLQACMLARAWPQRPCGSSSPMQQQHASRRSPTASQPAGPAVCCAPCLGSLSRWPARG